MIYASPESAGRFHLLLSFTLLEYSIAARFSFRCVRFLLVQAFSALKSVTRGERETRAILFLALVVCLFIGRLDRAVMTLRNSFPRVRAKSAEREETLDGSVDSHEYSNISATSRANRDRLSPVRDTSRIGISISPIVKGVTHA